jgi:hypothetical protein
MWRWKNDDSYNLKGLNWNEIQQDFVCLKIIEADKTLIETTSSRINSLEGRIHLMSSTTYQNS